jgi:hypothetical protein
MVVACCLRGMLQPSRALGPDLPQRRAQYGSRTSGCDLRLSVPG